MFVNRVFVSGASRQAARACDIMMTWTVTTEDMTLDLIDPTGSTEVEHLHAARLPDLRGKTVAMLSDDMWQAHRMLPLLRERLESMYDNIRVLPETEFPMGTQAMDSERAVDQIIEAKVDAVIVGNAA